CSLRSFRISSNQLEGPIPQSLVNCKNLELLDLGRNNLTDVFPYWLGRLNLQVLALQSNKFYGHIVNSEVASSFSHLRIINLSDNDFSGCLPSKFFESLHAISNGYENKSEVDYMGTKYVTSASYYDATYVYYDESLFVTLKGLEIEFKRILTTLTVIDFSNNRFSGQIPEIIGKLQSLIVLNLSHNSLTGPIPSSLSNLSKVESLDLSSNKLEGSIPAQLKNLGFLAVLNLSWNNFVGPIPQGKQFDTFTNDSYLGNLGLCGLPLSKGCGNDQDWEPPPTIFDDDEDTTKELNWRFSILIGYGCGLVLGLSMGYIVFTSKKPWWFIKMIERVQRKYVGCVPIKDQYSHGKPIHPLRHWQKLDFDKEIFQVLCGMGSIILYIMVNFLLYILSQLLFN
ncbi:Leucine-rich repeat - like 10, partial [Theobroma cacao]